MTVLVVSGSGWIAEVLSPPRDGHDVPSVSRSETVSEAMTRLDSQSDVHAIVSEQHLPDGTGIDFLRLVRQRYPDVPFVLAGPGITLSEECTAIEAGAADVVRLDESTEGTGVLLARVERALQRSRPRGDSIRATDSDDCERILDGERTTSQKLLGATSLQEVANVVVAAATTESDIAHAGMYLFDQAAHELRRVAPTPDGGHGDDAMTAAYEEFLRDTYVTGESHTTTAMESSSSPDADTQRLAGSSETILAMPVGEHGVLYVGSDDREGFGERTRRHLDLLVAAATASLERLEQRQSLQHREEALEEQATLVDELAELVDVLLGIGRETVNVETRNELERRVCQKLVESDRFTFAWIGTVDDRQNRIEPETWAGCERGYLDAVDLQLTESSDEPAVRAVRSRFQTVVDDVTSGLREDTWRGEALTRGFQSVLSVPLSRGDRVCGVLSVYATDAGAFSGQTQKVFRDIADAVTNGIGVLELKRALMADTVNDLELTLVDGTDIFSRVARETGARVELDGILPQERSVMLFLSVSEVDPSTVADVFEDETSVDAVSHASHGESELFEVEVQQPSFVHEIVENSGTLRELTADGDRTRLLVTIPVEASVRRFVETLERVASDVRLRSRTQRVRSSRSDQRFQSTFEQRVTDRQFEALRTAFLSGYFEWPRARTAEEVAGLLDISQPTFNRHLRIALRKLVALLFEPEDEQGDESR